MIWRFSTYVAHKTLYSALNLLIHSQITHSQINVGAPLTADSVLQIEMFVFLAIFHLLEEHTKHLQCSEFLLMLSRMCQDCSIGAVLRLFFTRKYLLYETQQQLVVLCLASLETSIVSVRGSLVFDSRVYMQNTLG